MTDATAKPFKNTAELIPADWNPRKIDDRAKLLLGESIAEFGDLSGIVVHRNGTLIAGHQRIAVIRERWGDVRIDDGWIRLPTGDIRVRVVDWNDETCRAASIAANNQAAMGKFTPDATTMIEDIQDVMPDLVDRLGLSLIEISEESDGESNGDGGTEGDDVPAMELQPFEHYDYLIILATNVLDWNALCAAFNVERTNSSPVGKKKIGLGRALPATRVLAAIDKLRGHAGAETEPKNEKA